MPHVQGRSLTSIRQHEAVRAFVRLGGVERTGKGSHRVVSINGYSISLPDGVLKEGLLRHVIKLSGATVEDFLAQL